MKYLVVVASFLLRMRLELLWCSDEMCVLYVTGGEIIPHSIQYRHGHYFSKLVLPYFFAILCASLSLPISMRAFTMGDQLGSSSFFIHTENIFHLQSCMLVSYLIGSSSAVGISRCIPSLYQSGTSFSSKSSSFRFGEDVCETRPKFNLHELS